MDKLIFTMALVLLAGIISLITGRNRRQIKRIPPGMSILCQPPGKRYMLYALGVMVLGVVGFFTVLFRFLNCFQYGLRNCLCEEQKTCTGEISGGSRGSRGE